LKRENGGQVSYDPRRLHGVTLYRETERGFSQGDRVQFTAPNREQHIANRELSTIEKIDDSGNLQLRLDSGRAVAFNIKENPHLDYGYAVTSHSRPGTNRRAGARACGYRAGGRKTGEPAFGLCGRVARALRCASLHERQSPA